MAQNKFISIDLSTGKKILKGVDAASVSFDPSSTTGSGISQNTVQEALAAEVKRAVAKENEINSAVEAEVERATGEEGRIEELITTHTGKSDIHVTNEDKVKWNGYEAKINGKVENSEYSSFKSTTNSAIEELKRTVNNKNNNTQVYETMDEFTEAAAGLEPKVGDLVFVVENKKAFIYKGPGVPVRVEYAVVAPEGWSVFDDISTELDLAEYQKTADADKKYLTKSEASSTYITTNAADGKYALKSAISDMLTKTEAGNTYAKKTEISDMLTKTEAGTTYAKKAEISDMLTKTEAGKLYRPVSTKINWNDLDTNTVQNKINAKAENSTVTELTGRVEALENANDLILDVTVAGGAAGDLVSVNSDGTYVKATLTTDNAVGILTATNKMAFVGKVTYTEGGLTPGKACFVGANSKPTHTVPSGSGQHIIKIGVALSANTILLGFEEAIKIQ